MAIPLLDAIDIEGKDISADALLTQREFARYLVDDRQAYYHFTVTGNQPRLLEDITLSFQARKAPHAITVDYEHGRIETRKIWTTTALNAYLDFPHVGQALHPRLRRFAIDVIKSKGVYSVAQKMRELTLNVRLVFDYLRMTKNSCATRYV